MKVIIGFILVFFIFYFIWQYVKRRIFLKFFKTLNDFPQHSAQNEQSHSAKSQERAFKKDIKWDAETVDFEEIPNKD